MTNVLTSSTGRRMFVYAAVTASIATLACSAWASAQPRSFAALPCTGIAKGALWHYKGQTGTTFTVLGVNGASCALGGKWLYRITSHHDFGTSTNAPAGWTCTVASTVSMVGNCTTKKGGIFEWLPKLKK